MRLRSIVLVGLMSVSSVASARQGGGGLRHEVRARVSEAVVTRVVADLALDPATAARLRAVIARHTPAIEAAEQARAQARRQLKQLLEARSNDMTAFGQASDALLVAHQRHQQLIDARQREVRTVLSPPQFGALLLELPRIERMVRQELMRAAGRGEGDEQ